MLHVLFQAKTTVWRHAFFLSCQTCIRIVHAEVTETTIVSETDKQAIYILHWFYSYNELNMESSEKPIYSSAACQDYARQRCGTHNQTHSGNHRHRSNGGNHNPWIRCSDNTEDAALSKLKLKLWSIDVLCKGNNFFVYFVYLLLLILLLRVTF